MSEPFELLGSMHHDRNMQIWPLLSFFIPRLLRPNLREMKQEEEFSMTQMVTVVHQVSHRFCAVLCLKVS